MRANQTKNGITDAWHGVVAPPVLASSLASSSETRVRSAYPSLSTPPEVYRSSPNKKQGSMRWNCQDMMLSSSRSAELRPQCAYTIAIGSCLCGQAHAHSSLGLARFPVTSDAAH